MRPDPKVVKDQFHAIVRAETQEKWQHLLSVRLMYLVENDLDLIMKNLWRENKNGNTYHG